MSAALQAYREALASGLRERRRRHLLRTLAPAAGVDFTSNDYLGLGRDPAFAAEVQRRCGDQMAGATASRLLRGHQPWHARVERKLAEWCNAEAALLFSSGFALNVGLYSALVGQGDLILSDELNHASIIDGIRLSKAERHVYKHQDLQGLAARLQRRPPGQRALVVTESLFSMDGDRTDLASLASLCADHGALLVVDEAHATGVWGAGRVAAEGLRDSVLATVHTGGKALGGQGAWIATDQVLVDHLVNHCRSFVFSTGVSPALCATLEAAVDWIEAQPWRRQRLHANRALFDRLALDRGLPVLPGSSAGIAPVMVADPARALEVAGQVQAQGLDVRAVRPPTVPTSRIRVTLHATHTEQQIKRLVDALAAALGQEGQ